MNSGQDNSNLPPNRDQAIRSSREQLERELVEAIESGEATEMTKADWARIREAIRARIGQNPNPGAASF